jgi:hypothetical protein
VSQSQSASSPLTALPQPVLFGGIHTNAAASWQHCLSDLGLSQIRIATPMPNPSDNQTARKLRLRVPSALRRPGSSNIRPPASMLATFRSLASTHFRASHQVLLSSFGFPSAASSNFYAPNNGALSARAQVFVCVSRAVSLRFAPHGLNPSCLIAGHRLTWRSSGTGQKLRFCPAPELRR